MFGGEVNFWDCTVDRNDRLDPKRIKALKSTFTGGNTAGIKIVVKCDNILKPSKFLGAEAGDCDAKLNGKLNTNVTANVTAEVSAIVSAEFLRIRKIKVL